MESEHRFALVRNERIKILKNQKFKVNMVMYEDFCTVFESHIEKNNMGIIHNVSKNITKVFGFSKDDIVGKNIN